MKHTLPLRTCCLLVLVALAGGCRTTGNDAGQEGSQATIEDLWTYWPVRMRLHPLTRIARDPAGDQLVIEARVEFLDRDEITTRGMGTMTITLYGGPQDRPADALGNWKDVDLSDPQVNRTHFDMVTRTYLFKLPIEAMQLPAEPLLRASFVSLDGRRFEDSIRLRPEDTARVTGAGG